MQNIYLICYNFNFLCMNFLKGFLSRASIMEKSPQQKKLNFPFIAVRKVFKCTMYKWIFLSWNFLARKRSLLYNWLASCSYQFLNPITVFFAKRGNILMVSCIGSLRDFFSIHMAYIRALGENFLNPQPCASSYPFLR